MCARKYMFGDKSTFGSCQNGQNMPKKGQQEINIFCSARMVHGLYSSFFEPEPKSIFLFLLEYIWIVLISA